MPVPFDFARTLLARVGVKTRMPWAEADHRLRGSADRLVRVTLEEMAHTVRRHGAVPVFLVIDVVGEPQDQDVPALRDAATSGMLVFNLLDLWRGRDVDSLRIASWDMHANVAGNRLIAERLCELMRQHAQELGLATSVQPRQPANGRCGGPAINSEIMR